MANKLNDEDIEIYLLKNTDFFIRHPSLLAELDIANPDQSISSLLDKQVKKLRDEQDELNRLLTRFLSRAKENEDLYIKTKNLILAMIKAKDKKDMLDKVAIHFKDSFQVEFFTIDEISNNGIEKLADEIGHDLKSEKIFSGTFNINKMEALFGKLKPASAVVSAINLDRNTYLLIKFGSKDSSKYIGDEGTSFLSFIKEALSSLLKRYDS